MSAREDDRAIGVLSVVRKTQFLIHQKTRAIEILVDYWLHLLGAAFFEYSSFEFLQGSLVVALQVETVGRQIELNHELIVFDVDFVCHLGSAKEQIFIG